MIEQLDNNGQDMAIKAVSKANSNYKQIDPFEKVLLTKSIDN